MKTITITNNVEQSFGNGGGQSTRSTSTVIQHCDAEHDVPVIRAILDDLVGRDPMAQINVLSAILLSLSHTQIGSNPHYNGYRCPQPPSFGPNQNPLDRFGRMDPRFTQPGSPMSSYGPYVTYPGQPSDVSSGTHIAEVYIKGDSGDAARICEAFRINGVNPNAASGEVMSLLTSNPGYTVRFTDSSGKNHVLSGRVGQLFIDGVPVSLADAERNIPIWEVFIARVKAM